MSKQIIIDYDEYLKLIKDGEEKNIDDMLKQIDYNDLAYYDDSITRIGQLKLVIPNDDVFESIMKIFGGGSNVTSIEIRRKYR